MMLGSVAMERNTQLSISAGTSVCVCVCGIRGCRKGGMPSVQF